MTKIIVLLLVVGLVLTACGGPIVLDGDEAAARGTIPASGVKDVALFRVSSMTYVTRFTDPETRLTCYVVDDGGIWCYQP